MHPAWQSTYLYHAYRSHPSALVCRKETFTTLSLRFYLEWFSAPQCALLHKNSEHQSSHYTTKTAVLQLSRLPHIELPLTVKSSPDILYQNTSTSLSFSNHFRSSSCVWAISSCFTQIHICRQRNSRYCLWLLESWNNISCAVLLLELDVSDNDHLFRFFGAYISKIFVGLFCLKFNRKFTLKIYLEFFDIFLKNIWAGREAEKYANGIIWQMSWRLRHKVLRMELVNNVSMWKSSHADTGYSNRK